MWDVADPHPERAIGSMELGQQNAAIIRDDGMDVGSAGGGDYHPHASIVARFRGRRRGEREEKGIHLIFTCGSALKFTEK